MKAIRTILLSALISGFTACPVFAETPVTKEMANQYFKNCMAKEDPRITRQAQEELCACTSAKMTETLSVQDIQRMSGNDQAARNALNKMLVEVYGPCMAAPTRDLILNNCLQNKELANLTNDAEALCGCIAEETAVYLEENAPEIISREISRSPNLTDPNAVLMASKEVESKIKQKTLSCMNLFR